MVELFLFALDMVQWAQYCLAISERGEVCFRQVKISGADWQRLFKCPKDDC